MFNFGGMMSGIGDVGYMKVKKGIQAKHDKQMIETRAALQRKALLEARSYSRTEQTRKDINERKERARILRQIGIKDDRTIASLAQSKTSTDMAINLNSTLQQRTNDTNDPHDINDFISTQSNVDKNFQNVVLPEFKLSSFLEGDIGVDLPFETVFAQKYLGKKLTSADLLAKKREKMDTTLTALMEGAKNPALNPPEKAALEKKHNEAYDSWFLHNEALKLNQAKEDLANAVPDKVDQDKIFESISKVNSQVLSRFNAFKSNITKEDDPVLFALLQKVSLTKNTENDFVGVEGNATKKEKDMLYNILAKTVVVPYLNSYKEGGKMGGAVLPQHVNTYPIIESYFKKFITPNPEDVFYGQAFIDAENEIPTRKYLAHLLKVGAGRRTVLDTGANSIPVSYVHNQAQINTYKTNFEAHIYGGP